jgi:beta-glucosidase/6-phospho-beta-glucosidase/beta-galactosidase
LPNATSAAIIPNDTQVWYGQSAWSSLWIAARLANYTTTGLYHTTVSPTPIPTSELIFPPENIPVKYAVDNYTFPSSFMFGVAGSASQCEGAVAMEGRTPSIQEAIYTNYSANSYVTNEHYFMYKQDILRLASMGVEYYSFSISWTRILPFVFSGTPVNKQGVDHYADVIDFTLAAGMKPIVTLLHFDNPLEFIRDSLLQKPEFGYHHGGFDNATWPDAFVAYGKLVMSLYAEKVPVWVTINEPMLYAANAIGISNVIHTHAELYKFYHNTINGTGKVGFKLNNNFGIPSDPSNETHVEAANWFNELWLGPIGYPICLSQDYPKAYKMTLKNVTSLTLTDLSAVGNTTDFFGIDPYTATAISPPPGGLAACAANASHPLHPYCVTQSFVDKSGWEIGYGSQGTAAYIAPKYFREYFSYVYNTYKKPVFITEFGFPVFGEATKTLSHQRFDLPRSLYYTGIMAEILKSIWEDGVQIIGALAWTFADDWE